MALVRHIIHVDLARYLTVIFQIKEDFRLSRVSFIFRISLDYCIFKTFCDDFVQEFLRCLLHIDLLFTAEIAAAAALL